MPSSSRNAHYRIHKLIDVFSKRGKHTTAELCKKLEVHRRTLLRDLAFLQDSLNLDIKFDAKSKAYYSTGDLPTSLLTLSLEEQYFLHLAFQFIDTTATSGLKQLAAKLVQKLDANCCLKPLNDYGINDLVSVHIKGSAKLAPLGLKILKAILEERALEFTYNSPGKPTQSRQFQPWHLAYIDNAWACFGLDPICKETRLFRLDRMSHLKLGPKFLRPAAGDKVKELIANAMGRYVGHGKDITLKVEQSAIAHLKERQYHSSQKLALNTDGTGNLTLHVPISHELINWILGWRGQLIVCNPPELLDKVTTAIEHLSKNHTRK